MTFAPGETAAGDRDRDREASRAAPGFFNVMTMGFAMAEMLRNDAATKRLDGNKMKQEIMWVLGLWGTPITGVSVWSAQVSGTMGNHGAQHTSQR
eukprot:Skav208040  [mRNA]  locus=scaffold2540:149165:149449:- [translate_table: standard]